MKITNKYGLPEAIVNLLTSDYQYKDKQFSATTILSGIKSFILSKRHQNEIEMDASEGINLVFGTAVHNIFEGKQNQDEIAEDYLKVKLPNGYTVSGRYDLFNIVTHELTDYKTCTIWKIKFKDYEDWRKQLLIYAWMIKQSGITVKNAKITALIKDYSKTDYRLAQLKGEYYPESAIINIKFEFNENDYQEIEKWIIHRFEEIEAYEKLPDDLIPECSMEERWNGGPKYAITKKGNVKAIRVLDSMKAAEEYLKENDLSSENYNIQIRPSLDRKCIDYCNSCEFCSYYVEHVKDKQK